jgi:hypothetical protein
MLDFKDYRAVSSRNPPELRATSNANTAKPMSKEDGVSCKVQGVEQVTPALTFQVLPNKEATVARIISNSSNNPFIFKDDVDALLDFKDYQAVSSRNLCAFETGCN